MTSKRIRSSVLAYAAFMTFALLPGLALGHGDDLKVGSGPRGPVSLSPAQVKALDLKVADADFRPLARLLQINGMIALLSNSQAEVSLRVSGRVDAVYVDLGSKVRKGDQLALVEARVVADPPPTIVVRAPMDGVVDARQAIIGKSVEPETTLFNISNHARMRVIGAVFEEDIAKVRVGQQARVRLLAYPDKILTGSVTLVGPRLDPDTRTVEAWIELDNSEDLLKPNMFAQADIVLGENAAALTVPKAAILNANGEYFVFVNDGGTYRRTEITLGASDDQYTEVTSGLVPGDVVVTQGAREIYSMWLTGGQAADKD